jgi:selenocysteine lyase/cysteine desulfurase
MQPGNVNFELSYSLLGVLDYFEALAQHHLASPVNDIRERMKYVYDLIARHEEETIAPLIDFLNSRNEIRIIGEASSSRALRVPTVSFVSERFRSDEIVGQVDKHKIGIRYGDFYARRLIGELGLSEKNGVVRISLVHYNTREEVEKLVDALSAIC